MERTMKWVFGVQCSVFGKESHFPGMRYLSVLNTEHRTLNTDPWSALLDADSLAPPARAGVTGNRLRVRTVRAGDRFQPLGMSGASVKLQDFFVNVKLPKRAREKWPLVCVEDEIAWVGGLRLAHPFRVTVKTKRALLLQIKKLP